ncbi:hypothetical protein RND71_014558 [Anisodus tanguticus]|uniref:Uncharacterized protein n=1 Tax=Anisodus tanguticus TaxID=243964 RepID=A0AAE1SC38_9SOLA|nr:hypothetical protein RND71_014558 [Anisodus tanguticus]
MAKEGNLNVSTNPGGSNLLSSGIPKELETPPKLEAMMVATKLTFSTTSSEVKPTIADMVSGNQSQHQGLQLSYFPPVLKEVHNVSRLNLKGINAQTNKWKTTLIGYVIGGNPKFKEMLRFVYGVWTFFNTP